MADVVLGGEEGFFLGRRVRGGGRGIGVERTGEGGEGFRHGDEAAIGVFSRVARRVGGGGEEEAADGGFDAVAGYGHAVSAGRDGGVSEMKEDGGGGLSYVDDAVAERDGFGWNELSQFVEEGGAVDHRHAPSGLSFLLAWCPVRRLSISFARLLAPSFPTIPSLTH